MVSGTRRVGIGTAIDKYCYISVRRLPPFFEHKSKIVYSRVELVKSVAEIEHPAVRGVLTDMGSRTDSRSITTPTCQHDPDLDQAAHLPSDFSTPSRARGRMISKRDLGREAIRIEQDVLKEDVGCQDQVWAAYGGFNRIDFHPDGNFR